MDTLHDLECNQWKCKYQCEIVEWVWSQAICMIFIICHYFLFKFELPIRTTKFSGKADQCYKILKNLCHAQRFNMVLLFLAEKDKEGKNDANPICGRIALETEANFSYYFTLTFSEEFEEGNK